MPNMKRCPIMILMNATTKKLRKMVLVSIPARNEDELGEWGIVMDDHGELKGVTDRLYPSYAEAKLVLQAKRAEGVAV